MNWKKQVNQKWNLPLFFMMFGLFIAETVAIFYMATLTATLEVYALMLGSLAIMILIVLDMYKHRRVKSNAN